MRKRNSTKISRTEILIVLLMIPQCLCEGECQSYSFTEVANNCGGCGLCQITTLDNDWRVCNYSFTNYFADSRCIPTDQCQVQKNKDSCKETTCVPMVGSFKCKCDSISYGRTCEFPRPQRVRTENLADVSDVILTPVYIINQFGLMSIFFNNLGENPIVSVITQSEFIQFDRRLCVNFDLQDYCKTWYLHYPHLCIKNPNFRKKPKWVLTIPIQFPALVYDHAVPLYQDPSSEDALGVQNFVTMKIENHGDSIFNIYSFRYRILVLYIGISITGCDPLVDLLNIEPTMSNAKRYLPRNEIIITSTIEESHLDTCADVKNMRYHWKIWKVADNHRQLFDKPLLEYFDIDKLHFKPFALEHGFYKVKLNVSVWDEKKRDAGYNFGYFAVSRVKLEAIISGGKARTVSHFVGSLTLDGGSSRNPNVSPSKQKGSLKYFWRCDKSEFTMCKETSSDYRITYTGPFQPNQTYTFFLTVQSVKDKTLTDTTSQRIFMVPTAQHTVELICKKNCGWGDFQSNPGVAIYFRAVTEDNPTVVRGNSSWVWTYSKEDEVDSIPVDKIQQNNTPNNVLIVLKDSLTEGMTYTFRAKGGDKTVGEASFSVKMAKKRGSISCSLGSKYTNITFIRGVTQFQVICDQLEYNTLAPCYDYYDTFPNRNDSGRLIKSSRSNIESQIVLFRGKLVVKVTDEYGMTSFGELSLELKDIESETQLHTQIHNLKKVSTSDTIYKTNCISIIIDLIIEGNSNFTDTSEIIQKSLDISARDEISNIPILKVWTDLLHTIVSENLKSNLSMKSIKYLSKAVNKLSEKLFNEIKLNVNLTEVNEVAILEIYALCEKMLKICDMIYLNSNEDLLRQRARKEDAQNYHKSYRESSSSMMTSVRNIMLCLSLITLPYEHPTIMKEDHISIWTKEDIPIAFSEVGYEHVPSVTISESLALSLSQLSRHVIVQVAQFNNNPYFYNEEFNIHTNVVDLQILFKTSKDIQNVVDLMHPVLINLKHTGATTVIVNGSVCLPDPNWSVDKSDMEVAVHQLRVSEMGRADLKFLDLSDSQTFVVTFLYNKRPDYEFMTEKDVFIVTRSSPCLRFDLKPPLSRDIYDLYYIGILPGANHSVGQCINYSFELSTLHCVSWNFHEWTAKGCKIKGATESSELHCECEKLSSFGGFSDLPMTKLDTFQDYQLLLTIRENFFPLLLLCVLLLLFSYFLLFAFWLDRTDKLRGKVIYLEDNFPTDKFSYLVAVFSGSKLFAGTTSNVGIMVEGENSCSRPHILRSSWCRTLRRGEDNWFLMLTPHDLGNLNMIHLWIDYSGKRPEWYCYKVIIVDLLSRNEYLFLVDAWLSLVGKDFVERFIKVTEFEDDKRLNIVVDNYIFGFKDAHLWLSLWLRHPRSIVGRGPRFSIACTELLIIMLVSCLVYAILEQRYEDYPEYTLPALALVAIISSIFLSSVLVNILLSLFRRTFLYKLHLNRKHWIENDTKEEYRRVKKHAHKSSNFLFRCSEDFVKAFFIPRKFKPVTLKEDEVGVPRKRKKYSSVCFFFGWTLSVVLIILCAALISYFGIKLEKVKNLVWLSCIALSLILILFLIAPIKISILAVLSGVFYYKLYEVVTYHIKLKLIDKFKRQLLKLDPQLHKKLVKLRHQEIYLPLTYIKIMKRLSKLIKINAALLLLDMFLIGMLVVLVFFQNETLWTTKHYWNNHQLRSLLRQGYKEEGIQLYSLTNLSLYSLNMERNVFPAIYQTNWYNGQPIVEGNSTEDIRLVFGGTSKLFGLPRLRQKRLRPDLCEKPIFENLSQHCDVRFTEENEDTELYAECWVSMGPMEKFVRQSPWDYMGASETQGGTLIGFSNKAYDGGGYVADLEMTAVKSEDIVITLNQDRWLDRLTCAVIFELTLYNAFTGTFSWLISVTENLHIGLLTNRVYVFTVSDEYNFPIVDIVVFLSLFLFLIRVFFVVNRNGIDDFVEDFWNIFEIVMVCLGIMCAILFILNQKTRSSYFKTFLVGDTRDRYFEYLHLLQYLDAFRILLAILVVLLLCRFVKCWKLGKMYGIFFKTWRFNWGRTTFFFLVIFLISYFYWRFMSHVMNNYMFAKRIFTIITKSDFIHIVKSCNNNLCKIIPLILCLISCVVQVLILVLFLSSFRFLKRKNYEVEPMNFFTVFTKKYDKYVCSDRKKSLVKC